MHVRSPDINDLALKLMNSNAVRASKQPDARSAEALEIIAEALVAILAELQRRN